jgi:hypothetical protein
MSAVRNIAEGWINLAREKIGIANPDVEILAKVRGEICLNCDDVSENEIICGHCGCHVESKIRATHSKCPIKKW